VRSGARAFASIAKARRETSLALIMVNSRTTGAVVATPQVRRCERRLEEIAHYFARMFQSRAVSHRRRRSEGGGHRAPNFVPVRKADGIQRG
jgi:hypothetical protein